MSAEIETTRWECEKCGGCGQVRHLAGAVVRSVVELIRAAHHAYAPSCVTDLARIRVTLTALSRYASEFEPRLLLDDVTECPTCGACTNLDAFVIYSIDRVLKWMAQCPDDAEAQAIYGAAIAEMRKELHVAPSPPDTP